METDLGNDKNEQGDDSAVDAILQAQGAKGEALSIPTDNGASGLEGEFTQDDLVIPYFSLVGKTGQLSDNFTPGSFVYNKEVVVSDGKTPLLVTALTMRKSWVEDIPFDPEIMPRRFDKLEHAMEEGYVTEYGAEKRVAPAASILLLVPVPLEYATFEAPKDLHEVITKQAQRVFNGQPQFGFARALYMVQNSAYNAVAKPLATATLSGHLRSGLHHGAWAFTSYTRTLKSNSWIAPKVASAGKHSPEFIQWINENILL